MHEGIIEDERGELTDVVPFCCDSCHRDYFGDRYEGWNGCHEQESAEYCANCGVLVGPLECGCDAGVVVNRLPVDDGEKCEHGNFLLLPCSYLKDFDGEPMYPDETACAPQRTA